MKYTKIKYSEYMKIASGQDGAIYNGLLFRFGSRGSCCVYDLKKKEQVSEFTLDRNDEFSPHSNAVFFGSEKFDESDEFPLLYTNLYNNYAKQEDRREGTLCVYRITREGFEFTTKLLQLIKIGFVNDRSLWKSMDDESDIRPYGNFILDHETNKLHAFVIRDKDKVTRYFEFDMPKLSDGEICPECGLKVVVLTKEMILNRFDANYAYFIQGACVLDGLLYSVEGGTCAPDNKRPSASRLQIMDLRAHEQCGDISLFDHGLYNEPEFIYPYEGILYYADCHGQLYTITVE